MCVVSLQMAGAARGKRLPYKRVLIGWRGEPMTRVQIVLVGAPLSGGKRRPFHVADHFPASRQDEIIEAAREAANLHGLELIEDTIGVVDPQLGPTLYSLRGGERAPRPGAA